MSDDQHENEQPGASGPSAYQPSAYESSEEFVRVLNESARLLGQNRPGEAVERLIPLHEAAPGNADVAINLGGAYILQRKWNRAVKVLRRAAAVNPTNSMLWTNLGAAELGALETSGPKQQETAIAAYQKALAADPEAPNVHYHLGLIYAFRREFIRAAAFFQRAVEVNPADRDALRWLERIATMADDPNAEPKPGDGAAATDGPFSLN